MPLSRAIRFALPEFSCILLALSIVLLPAALAAQTAPHWLTGYYATYNDSGVMTTSQVDYTKLTHVIYWPVTQNTGNLGMLDTTYYILAVTFAAGRPTR